MSVGTSSRILLTKVKTGEELSLGERSRLALMLAVPAILSQLTTIVMQYIDAAMVGHIGAEAMAAIGLVATSTWLLGGICGSLSTGFSVLVSHRIGAQNNTDARRILRQAIIFTLLVSVVVGAVSAAISPMLPYWLGGSEEICKDAAIYFGIFSLTIPVWEVNYLCAAMLRASGNVRLPALVNVGACLLDVVLNYLFIYHAHMGVLGVALGTSCSITVSAVVLAAYLWAGSPELRLKGESWRGHIAGRKTLLESLRIGAPIALEHIAMCSAHIAFTVIIAPLGTVAIAANGLAVVIEGLCYMPGYGIGDAATTLVGQSVGAKRPQLRRSFSWITLWMGVAFMTVMAVLMYAGVPYLLELMSNDTAVQALTTKILRIEAFAEPMYAASIVIYAIFVGAGDTLVPCALNLGSIWLVRIPLAMLLVGTMGLPGAWIAMATELCVRGLVFLVRLLRKQSKMEN